MLNKDFGRTLGRALSLTIMSALAKSTTEDETIEAMDRKWDQVVDLINDLPNIVLDYPVAIERSLVADGGQETTIYFANSCEFFMDEHGYQWVKFTAKNGYQAGKEHMIRTDAGGFMVVRDDRG